MPPSNGENHSSVPQPSVPPFIQKILHQITLGDLSPENYGRVGAIERDFRWIEQPLSERRTPGTEAHVGPTKNVRVVPQCQMFLVEPTWASVQGSTFAQCRSMSLNLAPRGAKLSTAQLHQPSRYRWDQLDELRKPIWFLYCAS